MLPEILSMTAAAISLLSASPGCSPTQPAVARVEFAWELEGAASLEPLALEISLLEGQFGPGPNRLVIELAPGTTRHVFEGKLVSNTIYHWRVRTLDGSLRVESSPASFQSAACAVGDQIGD